MSFYNNLINKIVLKEEAFTRLNLIRNNKQKIVFTNGCFDIIHPGHIDYLSKARDLGDFLVLGLNTDNSIKKLNKAKNRPINNEKMRAFVLAALSCVDLIVLFDDETPYELIKYLNPFILVKGSDYKTEKIIGYDLVLANGGEVCTIPLLEGYSTSKLIEKIIG